MILKTVAASVCLAALTHAPPPTSSNLTPKFDATGIVYEATHNLDFVPAATVKGDMETPNVDGNHLTLDKGDAMILEATKVENGVSLTRFAIDEADPDAPSTYWIRTQDLSNIDLRIAVQTEAQLFTPLPGMTAAQDDEYMETLEARRYGWSRARRHRGGHYCTSHPTSPRCCKSAVNYMLLRYGYLKTRVQGDPATSMASGLAKQHWREVGCSARSHPTRGMTCTYRGGKSGHTEAWNGHCWYYGASCKRTPMSQSNRICFSCKKPR